MIYLNTDGDHMLISTELEGSVEPSVEQEGS